MTLSIHRTSSKTNRHETGGVNLRRSFRFSDNFPLLGLKFLAKPKSGRNRYRGLDRSRVSPQLKFIGQYQRFAVEVKVKLEFMEGKVVGDSTVVKARKLFVYICIVLLVSSYVCTTVTM